MTHTTDESPTAFKVTMSSEQVLWNFDESDGSTPFSTLLQGPDGAVYGATYRGGRHKLAM